MAKLTKAIWGAADAGALPQWHEAGEECPAALEDQAKAQGALEQKAPAKK